MFKAPNEIKNKTLALAGIYQAATLVNYIAQGEVKQLNANNKYINTCLRTLFINNPKTTLGIYGDDISNLKLGIESLINQYNKSQPHKKKNIHVSIIANTCLALSKKVYSNHTLLNRISKALHEIEIKKENFNMFFESLIPQIANVYKTNISILSPRIIVIGKEGHVNQEQNIFKIRALLLAAIRSAFLWRQLSGTRWEILFYIRQYVQAAKNYKNSIYT